MLIAWVLVLVAMIGVSSGLGTRQDNNFSLKGTESQRALDLLERDFAGRSGDVDQIVFHARQGRIADPASRARIEKALTRVTRLPHVTSVVSPFAPGGGRAISRGGRIGFATVTFDEQVGTLPNSAAERVVSVSREARSADLQVELGGPAIEQTRSYSFGTASAVGLAAAIVVLLIAFGSFLAMGLPVITALLGLGTAFGVIALVSQVIAMPNFSSELAAMIGLGVGIDYALFIVTRFRENRGGGVAVGAATVHAMDTSGRAVLLAGTTVILALLGMLVLGMSFLSGLAVASAIAVLLTMIAALTALPALLARVGRRISGPRRAQAAQPPDGAAGGGFWAGWAGIVQRHPWPAAIAGLAIMLVVAIPALSLQSGFSDAGNDPTGTTTRKAYDLLADGFGKGFNGPLEVVAQLPHRGDRAVLGRVATELRGTPDVASVSKPSVSPAGRTAVYQVFPRSAPQADATTDLVRALRDRVLPPVERATGATLLVGGQTAGGIDFTNALNDKLPLFIAVVVGLAALLLLVVFRSLVIPLQAAVMNLLSIGAALGVTVAVFQHGWLGGLFGVEPGPVEAWLPVMLFAIVFGLSMDYEVFLVSRIHEEWLGSGDPSHAIYTGVATTVRVITAAATIMICVFLAFTLSPELPVKMFGLSLASAVFVDAFVVRSLLLPAVLELMGRRTWAFPAWLDRVLPRLATEPASEAAKEVTK